MLNTSFRHLRSARIGKSCGNAALVTLWASGHGNGTGQRQVGGQRRAILPALIADDLYQRGILP